MQSNIDEDSYVRQVRKRLRVSQKVFAKAIGISVTTLSNIENDCFESLSTQTIWRMMDFLECKYDLVVGLQRVLDRDDSYYDRLREKIKLVQEREEKKK